MIIKGGKMTRRRDDMSEEHAPRPVLAEGWREFVVIDAKETISKAGNEMAVVICQDKETGGSLEVYCVATKGKRWLLKSLLDAAGIKKDEKGVYEWEVSDLIETEVLGKVKNEDEPWVNREGETVTTTKSKIVEFKAK